MDSSSIVSSNNDTTYQTTMKGEYNNFSVHELALHAMRDRCLLLQRRINALENDNNKLKLDISKTDNSTYNPLQDDEKITLQKKIAELNKQKSQLLHHVFLVQCENKNLWRKIASLKGPEKVPVKEHTKQPLIRTNTYIHSTPKANTQYQEKFSESSLEEISLKLINSYIQEKSQLVEQYEQMAQLQELEADSALNVDSIGFTYLEDPDTDSLKEIQSQIEKFQSIKKEVAQQEKDLKTVISRIETLFSDGYKCSACSNNKGKSIKMEDKETEISNSLVNFATQTDSILFDNFIELNTSSDNKSIQDDEENDKSTEPYDKICPMCGESFKKEINFSDFQTHVESHFIGETEMDSLDNFENPSSFDNIS
ncbi:protein spindle-F [Colias croceus]|uniref:protein spindle-F n=1 Tax=Colias crocea TaxID=72248 RepID=UPI001E280686|nr:protein spindle-F [Colias croceus]